MGQIEIAHRTDIAIILVVAQIESGHVYAVDEKQANIFKSHDQQVISIQDPRPRIPRDPDAISVYSLSPISRAS